MDFNDCLRKGFLKIAPPVEAEIENELNNSADDLKIAGTSLSSGEFKWAIVQSYYCMFHAARACLYSRGYKERSHACIEVFLEKLVSDNGLDQNYLADYKAARFLREEANYKSAYSEERATAIHKSAEEFLSRITQMIK